MAGTKVSVIYYSATGALHRMAHWLATKAESMGAEVRLRQVAELTPQGPSHPTRRGASTLTTPRTSRGRPRTTSCGPMPFYWPLPTGAENVASQLKQFLDTLSPQRAQRLLADKVVRRCLSSQTLHGGQETTLTALYQSAYHFGGIVVAPGYTDPSKFVDGNPYRVSHLSGPANDAPFTDPPTSPR